MKRALGWEGMQTMKTPKTLVAAIAAMASFAFAPLASFATTYTWAGGASGNLSVAANWSPAPGGAFTASDELVVATPARITVDSAATVGTITLTAPQNVTFLPSDGAALTVTRIANTGTGVAQFFCPVQFSGTLYVEQNGAVRFPGGATATYPDPALRTSSSSDTARTLDGVFTFTANWSVPNLGDGNHPWRIASGSEVYGQAFTGTENGTSRILYIADGAYARFTTVAIGNGKGEIGIDGFLEATTEITLGGSATLGSGGKTGTVKAPCIRKTAGNFFYCNVPNIFVGAGGIGADRKDYDFRFSGDAVITATDNFDFLGVYNANNVNDWCFHLNGKTVTINIPEGLTATLGVTVTGGGTIRKTGKGTLVLTDTDKNGQSGYVKNYTGGTLIEEGTVRLAVANQIGTGTVTIKDGGRLEIAAGISFTNALAGDGTLFLENGTSLAVSSAAPFMGKVALASGANATVTVTDTPSAPAVLFTGVSASDESRIALPSGFAFRGGAAVMTSAAAASDYVWAGADGADWAVPGNWLVNGAAPAAVPGSGDTIRFENASAATVGGSGTLTVTKIVTTSGAAVTFTCPVAFAGTYLVENAAAAPVFAGGATATIPDASLTNMNVPSHILPDGLALTQDWTIPLQPAGRPFIVPAGARVSGKALTAETYNAYQPSLRVDAGAVATFDSIAVARRFVFWMNGGRLVATGDVTLGSETGGGNDFGYYAQPNVGIVEANGVYKSAAGGAAIGCYLTNFVVGAGGFGMLYHDYNFNLIRDTTLTAKADTTIHQPIGQNNEGDWGIELQNNSIFTVDTDGHRVVFDSLTRNTGGRLVKRGDGELVMQSRAKLHTGGTDVKAGKLTVNLVNGTGRGPTTVESGATLAFTSVATSHAYPLTVKSGATLEWAASMNMSSTLAIEAGTTLKPAQNACLDVSGGGLLLPGPGTVTIDMSGFTFTDGVAVPILGGVAECDKDVFEAVLPQDVSGEFSVSALGVLSFTSGSAADLYWNANAGLYEWSTSVAAWTNAAGMAMKFSDYANATIAAAAAITIPSDVMVNDVTVSADGDVTLSGAGKIGGAGTFTKSGAGTLTFNATGGLDQQPIVVSGGVFKLGDDLKDHALGGTGDSTPIIVNDGATLDLNYNQNGKTEQERTRLTHDKLIHIAGDGVDGRGALVLDSNTVCYNLLTALVLDDDASVGGTTRFDMRRGSSSADYARTATSIYGPGKELTVRNTQAFGIIGADITLDTLRIASGATVQFQYNGAINIANGIHIDGGTLYFEYGSDIGNTSVAADSGDCTIRAWAGNGAIGGPVTVASGATLKQTSGLVNYGGTVSGLAVTGGTANFNGAANGLAVSGGTANFGGDVTDLAVSGGTVNFRDMAVTSASGTGGVTCTNGVIVVGAGGNGGTVAVNSFPRTGTVRIEGGTLRAANVVTSTLLHRWSFNGDCNDAVGSNNAVFKGSGTFSYVNDNTEISLPGGGRGTGWLDCGSNIIPSALGNTPFTIELWVTPRSLDNWRQVFALGNNTRGVDNTGGMNTKGLLCTFKMGGSPYSISYNAANATGGNANWPIGNSELTANREYHIAFTVTPRGGNAATVTAYVRDMTTGSVRTRTDDVTDWTTTQIDQTNFWLGHSHWNDGDPAANYNEVRVWNDALSAEALALSAQKGADATEADIAEIAAASAGEQTLDMAGGTLDLGGRKLAQPVVKAGSGTVPNGTLDVTDSLVVNLADCIAGNCLAVGGTIDLTGATLVLEDPAVLDTYKSPITFLRATTGGSIVGVPVCPQLSKGWRISIKDGKARLKKDAFTIFIR